MKTWFLYIIRNGRDELYTGITTAVERRFSEHVAGGKRSAKFLRGKGPLELVFTYELQDRPSALSAERKVKRLQKADKERLVRGTIKLANILEGHCSRR